MKVRAAKCGHGCRTRVLLFYSKPKEGLGDAPYTDSGEIQYTDCEPAKRYWREGFDEVRCHRDIR